MVFHVFHPFLQLEALELARGGARQLVDDTYLARPLMTRQHLLGMPHELGLERGGLDRGVARHDEHEGLDEARGLCGADHARLEHRGVLHQRGLDVGRHHPLPGDLEKIVLAPRMPCWPSATGWPASSSSLTSLPSTTVPVEPARLRPAWFERKMNTVSVAPMPSRISTPKRSRQP